MFRAAPARLLFATAVTCLLLALGVRAGGLDRELFVAVNEAAWRWLPPAAPSCLTILGHGLSATMLLAPTLLRAPGVLAAALYGTPVALLLSHLPKALIDSPRPAAVLDPASIHVTGLRLAAHNSMPSGHAITALLVVGVLLSAGPPLRLRPWSRVAIAIFGVAVALSRIAVGAHWPSDVLAGAGLGLIAAIAGTQAQRRWPITSPALGLPLLAAIVLTCSAVLAWSDLGYPLARPLQGLLAGLGAVVAVATLWRLRRGRGAASRLSG
jgi:membrane-associated phospholipid phosphatase